VYIYSATLYQGDASSLNAASEDFNCYILWIIIWKHNN